MSIGNNNADFKHFKRNNGQAEPANSWELKSKQVNINKMNENDFVAQNRNFIQFLDAAERGVFSNRKNSRGSSCTILPPSCSCQ